MGRNVSTSLSLLSLDPERKVKCYNEYFVNGYVFHTKEYGYERKTYNSGVDVKGSTCREFEIDYYNKLKKRSLNCNIIVSIVTCVRRCCDRPLSLKYLYLPGKYGETRNSCLLLVEN